MEFTTLGWIGLGLLLVGGLRWSGFLRGLPIAKKQAGVVALIGLLIFAYGQGYISSKEATIVGSGDNMPVLATFKVDVSSTTNANYDKDTKTFTIAVSYDSVNDAISPTNATLVFTVQRTDLGTDDAVAKVRVNNLEWYNLTTKYTLLSKALITPEGGAAVEDEALVLLPAAAGKTVTVQLTLDKEAIKSMDVYTSKSFTIEVAGEIFTVNVIRTA